MDLVCGRKRSYLHEEHEIESAPLWKKPRCVSQVFETQTHEPEPFQTNSTNEPDQPQTGSEWVDLLVKEMLGATSMVDAKSCAEKVLEKLANKIHSDAREETLKTIAVEKDKTVEVLSKENALLKKAVAMQYEKCKGFEEREMEMKKLVCGYEERLKTLEANNYALSMHLNQALKGGSSYSFHNRDVF